jgi:phosphoribosyl 1,2-cyclic phosphodiesterase
MSLRACSLFSSSSGNAIYVRADDTRILVDAGMPGKKIESALSTINVPPESLDAILVTHEHSDHIKGVGVMSRRYDLPIYANYGTWSKMEKKIGKIDDKNIRVFMSEQDFYINQLNIYPYRTPHDAAESVGYNFMYRNKKISIATDLGHTNHKIINALKDSDVVILESNHDVDMLWNGSYPDHLKRRVAGTRGHLSNEAAAEVLLTLIASGTRHILLAHLSKENNTPTVALDTMKKALANYDIVIGKHVSVDVASPDITSNIYKVG